MMKRMIGLILALCLMCPWAGAMGMANPWTDTTAEIMADAFGLTFCIPDSAENIAYRMIESESLAEVQFDLNGAQCVARIKPALAFEDISGMYYDWETVEDCEILWCPGTVMQTAADGQRISLCMWYDVVPGLMYSVSVMGEMDVLSLANALFIPAQGDADASAADVLAGVLAGCVGYEGTAGSSLKEAIAATELLAFAVEYADVDNIGETVENAMLVLPEQQKQELSFSLEGIRAVIEFAFADYDSIAGLFDDAGVGERIRQLIQIPDVRENWAALIACF